MKNRWFAVILAVVMMITFMPAVTFAATGDEVVEKAITAAENPDCSDSPFTKDKVSEGKVSGSASAEGSGSASGTAPKIQKYSDGAASNEGSDWELSDDYLYLEYNEYDNEYTLWAWGEELYDISVRSSNSNVVSIGDVEYDSYDEDGFNYTIKLRRQGGGKANVIVTDDEGNSKTCVVTCEYTPYKPNLKSYTFSKKKPYDSVYIYNKYWGKDREIVKVKSSNKKVATVKRSYGEAIVTPKKAGKATITVTDRTGKKTSIRITVAKNWKKANLKYNSGAYISYSGTKAYVYSKPNTRFTLKIGGKTYKKKINKKGYCYVNIKKHYKLNKKYTVSFNNKGVRCTVKGKVKSDTYAYKYFVCGSNNYAQIKVYNATKGDRVYIRVGGKWFSTKLSWSGDGLVTIWPSESLYYYGISKLVVKNKYKQVLYSYTY